MNSNPTPAEKARMLAKLKDAADIIAMLPENRSCKGCDRYDEGGTCALFRAVVPREFVDDGCGNWIEKVPF